MFGHPKTNEPAYGWVEKLKREGGCLYAKYKDVADDAMIYEFSDESESEELKQKLEYEQ